MQPVRSPLRISYPANLPYAAPGSPQDGLQAEVVGDRVIVTYTSLKELRECLELHREARRMQADVTPDYAKLRLVVSTKELI
jgi:hypothetical protein